MLGVRMVLGGLTLVAMVAGTGAAHAAVNVNIGINLAAPPRVIVVPGTPVAYAPGVPGNYFVYAGQFYVFANGAWYASRGYNGPWVLLAPAYVPQPLLAVPVQYYHVRPRAWAQWRREAPPRWTPDWGRGWQDEREHRAVPQGHGDRRDGHRDERH